MLQTNNTGVGSQCLSHPGSAPAHGACSLPVHTARTLGCSAGNNPRPALGCMHLPGPSCSGSGTRVVLRGADSVGQRDWIIYPRHIHFLCLKWTRGASPTVLSALGWSPDSHLLEMFFQMRSSSRKEALEECSFRGFLCNKVLN